MCECEVAEGRWNGYNIERQRGKRDLRAPGIL